MKTRPTAPAAPPAPPPPRYDYTNWRQVLPPNGVIAIQGFVRMGKSVTAWNLAELSGKPLATVGVPPKARALFPEQLHIRHLDSVDDMRTIEGYCIVTDEASFVAPAREAMSHDNKETGKAVALAGQHNHLLIYISQHSYQIDTNIFRGARMILFKLPSVLQERTARAELRPDFVAAREAILAACGKNVDRAKRYTYIREYLIGMTGLLTNKPPVWWTEEISTAFRLEGMTEKNKKGAAAPVAATAQKERHKSRRKARRQTKGASGHEAIARLA